MFLFDQWIPGIHRPVIRKGHISARHKSSNHQQESDSQDTSRRKYNQWVVQPTANAAETQYKYNSLVPLPNTWGVLYFAGGLNEKLS